MSNLINEDFLKKALNLEGKINHLIVEKLCSEEENFASKLFEVNFNVSKSDSMEEPYYLILKYPDRESYFYKIIQCMNGYEKEVLMYSTMLPDALDWQKNKFGKVKFLFPVAKIYYFNADDSVILMQNLKKYNYYVKSPEIGRNIDECKVVLKSLSIFHAILVGYKQSFSSDDEFYKKYSFIKCLKKEILKKITDPSRRLEIFSCIVNVLNTVMPDRKDLFERFLKHVSTESVSSNVFTSILPNNDFNVITHGDLKNSNIMFMNNLSGSCNFIDLQMIKYCSPAADLSYFLWTSTSTDTILNHSQELIKVYYDSLKSVANDLDSNISLTFNTLYENFVALHDAGLQFAVMTSAMKFAPQGKHFRARASDTKENPLNEFVEEIKLITEQRNEALMNRFTSLVQLGEDLKLY